MGQPRMPLPSELLAVASRQGGLLSATQVLAAGVPRARLGRLAQAGVLRRVARGVYDVADRSLVPTVRAGRRLGPRDVARLRAAVFGPLLLGPAAVVTGVCALVLHGVEGAPQRIRPEVAVSHGGSSGKATGVRVRRLDVRAVRLVDGHQVVTPDLAFAQAIGDVDRDTAVAMLDSARYREVLTERAFHRARELARRRRGVAGTWEWWNLSDRRAQSPAETAARLTCSDAGCPPDALQLAVRDERGAFLADVDLGWRLPDGRWLLGEVDGVEFHSGRRDVLADLARQNRIVTDATILRRWTGTQAQNGTLAREAAAILKPAGWRPNLLPTQTITLTLRPSSAR